MTRGVATPARLLPRWSAKIVSSAGRFAQTRPIDTRGINSLRTTGPQSFPFRAMRPITFRLFGRRMTIKSPFDTLMSEHMKRGHDDEPTDPLVDTPFSGFHQFRTFNRKDELIQQATATLRYLERDARTATDKDLRRAAITENDSQMLAEGRFGLVAVLLSTADTVEWNGSYTLTPDAPEYKSEEWVQATSQFEIPDTRRYDGVPKAVSSAYRHMEKVNRKNDAPRPVHSVELRQNARVHMPERRYGRAWEYLAELPGVDGTDADAPTWALADRTAVEQGGEAPA